MAHTHRTARKSTGRLPIGQLAPQNMSQPQELEPDVPQEASQEEEPFEIELVVPESPIAQDSPAEEQQQLKDQDIEDKANEEYTPPSDAEDEKMYRDADEVESFGVKTPVLAGRLQALLEHLGITIAPRYKIKEVPCSGQVEFKAIAEIYFGSRVLCRHKGPAFRTSHSDAIADAAWQAITSWLCSNMHRLQNSVHSLLPYRKKDRFKAYGVKKDIPRMEMVHHQDVTVELSTRLLVTQCEIETLRIQLQNTDTTIRGYMRMVEGQASDLYASDTDTWTATSSVQSSGKVPAVSSHSPFGSRSHLESPKSVIMWH
jgi:hypothetical protein